MTTKNWIQALTPAALLGGPMLIHGFHGGLIAFYGAGILGMGLIGLLLELQSISKKLDELNKQPPPPES